MKVQEKRKSKRIFGACILFPMMLLALITVALAANDDWVAGGSYSLIIEKQFDQEKMPAEVLEEAKKQTYSFRIKGYRLDRDEKQHPIDQIVKISAKEGWKSEEFHSDGPIHVSVTEITNNITLKVDGKEYNMGDSRAETQTLFKEPTLVRELNNNGKIVLSRPSEKTVTVNGVEQTMPVTTTSFFRITSEWNADPSAKPQGWKPYNETVELKPGGDTIELNNLSAGKYTIEDLSVSGYNLKLGSRTQSVRKDETGQFYINSYPGKLEITAGGAKGDGDKHYYTIERVGGPDDARPFADRTTDAVESGGTYVLDELPRGEYKVTEYTFSNAPGGFTVKLPQTEERECEGKSSALTTGTKNYWKKMTFGSSNGFEADYVRMVSFGPLYNEKGVSLNSTTSYAVFRYGVPDSGEGNTVTNIKSHTSGYTGNKTTNIKNAPKLPVGPNKWLYFTVTGLKSSTAKTIGVKWIAYDEKEVTRTFAAANINHSVVIDERGWIEITAPAVDSQAGAEDITYTYYLRKPGNEGATQELTLDPDSTKRFEGLEAGSYLVMEVVNYGEPVGFDMTISGGDFGSTEAGKPFDITVMDERELTITKLGDAEKDGGRIYTFKIERADGQAGTGFSKTVELKAGDHSEGIPLPKGRYKVTPVDDMTEVFVMRCSDSSQVHAEVAGSSSVTFTNVFTPGTLGYRYVHEYYLKKDGQYVYEGDSLITTVGGRNDARETYNSVDIIKEPVFTYEDPTGKEQTFHYAYMPENNGYGKVVTDAKGDSAAGNGLRLSNRAYEKSAVEKKQVYYQVDNDLTQAKKIGVDKDKKQVIILRYFRVLPEDQLGSYNYIHIYYRRDKEGNHWEGTSSITSNVPGQLNIPYDVGKVAKVPQFTPTTGPGAGTQFTYTYEQCDYGTLTEDHSAPHIEQQVVPGFNDTQTGSTHYHYNPNSNANHIVPTVEGKQVIILRYYRDVRPGAATGNYKVVHEYYYREKLEDSGGAEDSESEGTDTGSETPDPSPTPSPSVSLSPTPESQLQATENSDSEDGEASTGANSNASPPAKEKSGGSGVGGNTEEPGNGGAEDGETPDPSPTPSPSVSLSPPPESPPQATENFDPEGGAASTGADPNASPPAEGENTGITLYADENSAISGTGTLGSSDGTYSYRFEGARDIETVTAPLGTIHKVDEVRQWLTGVGNYAATNYAYLNEVYGIVNADGSYSQVTNQEWAASTVNENHIIILRYIRGEDVLIPDPTPDPAPSPSDPPDSPDTVTEPPADLGIVPATGDTSGIGRWAALAAASLCGLVVLMPAPGKRKTRSGKRKD